MTRHTTRGRSSGAVLCPVHTHNHSLSLIHTQVMSPPGFLLHPADTNGHSEWHLDSSRLQLGRRIAVGGFAEVYVGRYEGTLVAVKRLFANDEGVGGRGRGSCSGVCRGRIYGCLDSLNHRSLNTHRLAVAATGRPCSTPFMQLVTITLPCTPYIACAVCVRARRHGAEVCAGGAHACAPAPPQPPPLHGLHSEARGKGGGRIGVNCREGCAGAAMRDEGDPHSPVKPFRAGFPLQHGFPLFNALLRLSRAPTTTHHRPSPP